MVRGFTPIIGLAVVVALALAAVFGSMSLANPAMAAVGQPADAELTDRTASPQENPLPVYTSHETVVDLAQYIEHNDLSHIGISAVMPATDADRLGVTGESDAALPSTVGIDHDGNKETPAIDVNPVEVDSDGEANIEVTPNADAANSEASVTLYAMDGDTADDLIDPVTMVTLTFDIQASTAATSDDIPNQNAYIGAAYELNLFDYFTDGLGTGDITAFSATETTPGTTDPGIEDAELITPAMTSDDFGKLTIAASALDTEGTTTITVTATAVLTDPAGGTLTETIELTVMPSTPATDVGSIADMEADAGTDPVDVILEDKFDDGAGTGKITGYAASSDPGGHVSLRIGKVTDDKGTPDTADDVMVDGLTIRPLTVGYTTITVYARDGFGDMDDDPTQEFIFEVTDPSDVTVPAPNMPSSLRYEDNTASDAADDAGSVTVRWGDPLDDRITSWQYSYKESDSTADDVWMTIFSGRARYAMISGLTVGTEYTIKVRARVGSVNGPVGMVMVTPAKADIPTGPEMFLPRIEASSYNPAKNARYTVMFNASKRYVPGVNDLVVQFTDEDFQVPSTIATSTVTVQAGSNVANPSDIAVDDQEITMVLGDMDPDTDGVQNIEMGQNVTIIFRTAAGIKNPEEGGSYGDMTVDGQTLVVNADDPSTSDVMETEEFTVKRTISLSEDEGGRGDDIMVTGKGFKNGTSVTFLRMESDGLTAADFNAGTSLCTGLAADGVATCSFTITSPLFKHGDNFINAVDGRSNRGTASEPFNLEPSISVSPTQGSPGDSLLVQLYDFAPGATVSAVKIARRTLCTPDAGGAVSLMAACGTGYSAWVPNGTSFRVVIPNDAPLGLQDLQVVTTGGDDNTNITISGPLVTSTPSTVLANQRVSLIGNGFTPSSTIKEITFAGTAIDAGRINDGQAVRIDGGGNWNASVNLPLSTSTVSSGVHTVRIEDNGGRSGGVKVTVPERKVSITPDSGRVGTIAVVRGENFPSRNEEGNSFNVQIVYGSGVASSTTVSTVPDASGRFEAQMRIPTTSAIPSTNDVSVSFGTAQNGGPWTINVSHDVPEGIINLSATSGSPGSSLTISGEGFRSFVPVNSVMIGSIDITPTPRPSSDVNGMVSFDVIVPGLDVGIQTIEVQVGKTTASAGFTVTESGVNPGDIKPVAEALEPLGDNLDSIWHFNNDSKVWSFYDGLDGSDLVNVITGETYLIQVKATQEVILNHKTRNLTCNAGNCWNQIVW